MTVVSKALKSPLSELRISPDGLPPDEIRFLEDSLNQEASWMLENEKARQAIFGEASSEAADRAYRKLFFSRLDPHSGEEMSAFFESLDRHRRSILRSSESGDGSSAPSFLERANAWRKATVGILDAVKSGEFDIRLSDFQALYGNHINDKLNDPDFFVSIEDFRIPLKEEVRDFRNFRHGYHMGEEFREGMIKQEYMIDDLLAFIHGTEETASGISPVDQDTARLLFKTFEEKGIYRGDIPDYKNLSKPEKVSLIVIGDMFSSPFCRPSGNLWNLFQMVEMFAPWHLNTLLNDANFLLRLWNSDRMLYRNPIFSRLSNVIDSSVESTGFSTSRVLRKWEVQEVHQILQEDAYYKALAEAALENEEIGRFLQRTLGYIGRQQRSSPIRPSGPM